MVNLVSPGIEAPIGDEKFLAELELLVRMLKRLRRYRPNVLLKSANATNSMEFLEYRSYLPGDDLRRVDWNVYKRFRQLVMKEYALEAPAHWVIGLDISKSMLVYRKFAFARRLAAALIYVGLSLVSKVSCIFFPGPPKFFSYHGEPQVQEAFQVLTGLQVQQAEDRSSFRYLWECLPRYATVFLVSDFYGKSYQELLPLFSLKHMHGIALHCMAWEEFHPDLYGKTILQDAESEKTYEVYMTKALLQEYQKRLNQHIAQVKSFCLYHGVAYQEIPSTYTLEKALLAVMPWTGLLRT